MKRERPDLSERVRQLPHQPGVYMYKDRFDTVIYVGKARNLNRRVSQYFQASRRNSADRKTLALIDSIWDFEYHTVRSNPEAILLEGKLIKEYRPRYNVTFRDDKRFLLVRMHPGEAWPRFSFTRMRKDDGARYFGPFAHSSSVRTTIAHIQKQFGIRACKPREPGEGDFKHCLDHVIKACSAPCVGRISREDYLERVEQACLFLEGRSREMLGQLEEEMKQAATDLNFEKAARLRDLLDDLKKTSKPTKRFHRRFVTSVNPDADMRELGQALGLSQPPRVIECFDISNISTTHKVASMVCFRDGTADNPSHRRYRIRTVDGQNDFASMAEAVRRRYQRVLTEGIRQPDLIIVDGGKGQLSSAHRELASLGLEALPVIGLAKQREEVFRVGESKPLLLDHGTGALRLLQRIRDEAHRVANGYHSLLLKKRVSESILDDCPGVSENRKKLLLTHFGTIDKLKQASTEDISAIEGVGPKTAQGIVDFFANLKTPRATNTDNVAPDQSDQDKGTVYQLDSNSRDFARKNSAR